MMTQYNETVSDPGELPFLELLAGELQQGVYGASEDVVIVLPGKRARLFLNRALAARAGRPLWAPEVFTMEEFIFDLLGLQPADDLSQVLALWEICRSTDDFVPSFDQFSGWAPIVLRDFNDTDLFLADPQQVFSNLRDARELQMWVPGGEEELTTHEALYLAFYNRLYGWYCLLRDTLLSSGRAWQGLAFRMAAERGEALLSRCAGKRVLFAGFNAFTPSEERIITVLERAGIALLRWDADSWYLDDEMQEAGYFLRRWKRNHSGRDFQWVSHALTRGEKEISVYGVHGNRAQARLAGEMLKRQGSPSPETAVVLPDESLLLPVLNAIPENIRRFNVTMGLPFRHTPALSWLQLNMRLAAPGSDSGTEWVRVANLIPLLRHPWFMTLVTTTPGAPQKIQDPVALMKQRFYMPDDLIAVLERAYPHCSQFIRNWLTPSATPEQWLHKMEMLLRDLLNILPPDERPFDRGAILEAVRILLLAGKLPGSASSPEEGFSMLRFLLNRLLNSATIPFTGEPLEGIQILGLLETRNLDFKHVILLAANERILPAGRKPPTLIPADIRKHHRLPGVQHLDAIYAYHFFHLLQRARKIDIIYNSDASSDLTGEMSRFIRQIESELVPANPKIKWQHHKLSHELFRQNPVPPVIMVKDDAVYRTLLNQISHRGLSPSQISRYIRCPLMFYFSFVASLDEALPYDETIDLMELGTLVHATLQEIYSEGATLPAKPQEMGAVLDDTFFAGAVPKVRDAVMERMKMLIGGSAHITGRNLIIAEVADFMVSRFLENEREAVKENGVEVLAVELGLEYRVALSAGSTEINLSSAPSDHPGENRGVTLLFKGVADRVDRCNNTIRVTDYKTGKVEPAELKWKSIEELFSEPAKQKAFQLMFYCWLYDKTHRPGIPVNGGVFTLKNPSTFLLMMPALQNMTVGESKMLVDRFEEGLFRLCSEILNRDIPFVQTNDSSICRTCPYHPICQTETGGR